MDYLTLLENADVVAYALFLVLGYAFGNPGDVADLLSSVSSTTLTRESRIVFTCSLNFTQA